MFHQTSNFPSGEILFSGSDPTVNESIVGSGVPALHGSIVKPSEGYFSESELPLNFQGLVAQIREGRVTHISISSGSILNSGEYSLSVFRSYSIQSAI